MYHLFIPFNIHIKFVTRPIPVIIKTILFESQGSYRQHVHNEQPLNILKPQHLMCNVMNVLYHLEEDDLLKISPVLLNVFP